MILHDSHDSHDTIVVVVVVVCMVTSEKMISSSFGNQKQQVLKPSSYYPGCKGTTQQTK